MSVSRTPRKWDKGDAERERSKDGQLECITQDPREPADVEFLENCDNTPVHVMCSMHCPPDCGGHLVCDPCCRLGIERGLIRKVEAR